MKFSFPSCAASSLTAEPGACVAHVRLARLVSGEAAVTATGAAGGADDNPEIGLFAFDEKRVAVGRSGDSGSGPLKAVTGPANAVPALLLISRVEPSGLWARIVQSSRA